MSLSHTRHNEYLCILPAPGRHSGKFLFVKRCWNYTTTCIMCTIHNNVADIVTSDELIFVMTIWCQNWVFGEYHDLLASRWRVFHPESCPRVLRPNHNCGLTRQYAGRQIVHTRANWCHAKEQIGNWPGKVLASKKLWSAKTRRTQEHTHSSWKNFMHNKCIYWKK